MMYISAGKNLVGRILGRHIEGIKKTAEGATMLESWEGELQSKFGGEVNGDEGV